MGATGALALALARGRLTLDLIRQAAEATAKLSAFVIFILIGSRVFSLTFYGLDGHRWVESMLTALPGGQIGFLAFINVFVFVLAFFLDFFEIAFIIIPLLTPAAQALNIDLIWFGVMICATLQTSFMHPPFGFALFYLRGITPREVRTRDIYLGAIPWLFLQVALVVILIFFPQLVTAFLAPASTTDLDTIQVTLPPDQNLDLGSPPAFDISPPNFN
jgi:TRAP-type mannitol/chloroaromatic compound transport system permease large subunit